MTPTLSPLHSFYDSDFALTISEVVKYVLKCNTWVSGVFLNRLKSHVNLSKEYYMSGLYQNFYFSGWPD